MLEVEMKFTGVDFVRIRRRLARWGARGDPTRREADHYLNAPDRDFARTDEALRVRRIGRGNFVTYKGPRRDQQTKTRTEVEVPLAEEDRLDEARQALLNLAEQLGLKNFERRSYLELLLAQQKQEKA